MSEEVKEEPDTPEEDAPKEPLCSDGDKIGINPMTKLFCCIKDMTIRMMCHKQEYERYKRLEKIIGYVFTISSAFLTSSFLVELSRSAPSIIVTIVNLILSATSLFLSITKDNMQFGNKSKTHEMSFRAYQALIKEIDKQLVARIDTEDLRTLLKTLSEQTTAIEQYEPTVSSTIEAKIKKEYVNSLDLENSIIIS